MKKTTNSGVLLWDIPKFDLKMKLTTIFLIVSLFRIQASTYSQTTKITLDLDQVSVEKVLDEIERNTDFKFLADTQEINLSRIISVRARNQRIKSILNKIFSNGDVVYSILGKQIILKKNNQKQPNIKNAAYQQSISGITVDASGQPLPGVNVIEKGTGNGTSSDFDGNYSINVSSDTAVLVFSSIGYETKEVPVNGQSTINVTLSEDTQQLGEVVVTSLGITREKKAVGYATATIQAAEITETATPNFATALYGKAPGVQISATPGGPTSAVNITIRGVNSITGRSQPLIILDGVPIRDGEVSNNNYWNDQRLRGNGLLDINPEDVESISILKGASAAALYGSQAVNGVILITTKKGKGKWNVNLNISTAIDKVAYLPRFQNVRGQGYPTTLFDAGQGDDMFVLRDVDGDGVEETRGLIGTSVNFGPKFDGQPIVGWDGIIRPYSSQPGGYSALFQTALNTRMNISMAKGDENSSFRLSYTREDSEGVSLNSNNEKNTFNVNNSFTWAKNVTTDVVFNYVNKTINNRPYGTDRLINNFGGMMGRFDNAKWYRDRYQTSMGYRFVTNDGQSLTPDENIRIPGYRGDILDYMWRVNKYQLHEYSDRILANLTTTWGVTDEFSIRGRVANDFTSERVEDKRPNERPLAFGNSGHFSMANSKANVLYGEVMLNYTKQLTPDLEITARAGYNATQERFSQTSRGTNGGLSVENWFDIASSVNTPNSGSSRNSFVTDAFVGVLNFDYKGFLFAEGTIRRDRTSTMHPDNNSFVYPSVNTSFLISEAFEMPHYIDLLKVRGAWGIVGNYPDRYGANIAYNQNTLGTQGANPVLYTTIPTSFGNDGIRPEEKHDIEVGLESSFFKGRLVFEGSYYNAKVIDQILPLTLPNSSGAGSVLTNIGTLRNKGIELSLRGTPIVTEDFTWDLGINASHNRNTVEKLAPGLDEISHANYDGDAARLISRVGESMGDIMAHPVATDANGNKIVDPNGLYRVDADRVEKFGNAMPKMVGGIFNTFTYKNFTLDALTDFRIGGHVMPTSLNWMISRGLLEESLNYSDESRGGLRYYQAADGTRFPTSGNQGPNGETVHTDGIILDGVQADGSQNDVIVSNPEYYLTVYNWGGPQYSPNTRYDLYIQENTYFKMRELSLGYSFPKKVLDKIGFESLNLSVFGRNLFYFYRSIKDMDGEQLTAGSRWTQNVNNLGTNPSTRTYGLMLRAKL
ncbi:SusC/RagA family TonB-linked outer membrane protein [Flagellimonas sp.]|uniref:SusC/RagA family TonB-linked outer membrane protein n=1 Tax=Flagellimonas sp. TaxID=2058762 RepID=UPI003B503AB2